MICNEYEELMRNYNDGFVSEDYDWINDKYIQTYIRKKEHEPTLEEIKKLRKEIVLNSIYVADYENSFWFDEHDVCGFFDGYMDYLEEELEMQAEESGERISDRDYYDRLFALDNEDNLEAWFYCYECLEFTQYYFEQVEICAA